MRVVPDSLNSGHASEGLKPARVSSVETSRSRSTDSATLKDMDDRFREAYRRGFAVAPVVGDGISAMSRQRQADLLAGHDPVVVLEASSTVLACIEARDRRALTARLPRADQVSLDRWYREQRTMRSAPVPLAPLAALAATTLALGQSAPAERTDARREAVAGAITQVGLRLNEDVFVGGRDPAESLDLMARTALWRAVEQEDWLIWSGELLAALADDPKANEVTGKFLDETGLTIREWFARGLGERATRARHGAGSWKNTDQVDPALETAWMSAVTTPVKDAETAARQSLARAGSREPFVVVNPFDLSWLASKPLVLTEDGRRFLLWIGALNRCLLPAGIAQTLADRTGVRFNTVSERLGRAGEQLLTARVQAMPEFDAERRTPEAAIPEGQSTCDYLIERDEVLVGVEFTIASPSRALGEGGHEAVTKLVDRFADKIAQAYAVFEWADPLRRKRWLPVLVLESPTVVDPLLNEEVHQRLVERGILDPGQASELMTCHVTDLLDLVQHCIDQGISLAQGVVAWRDSDLRGTALDWWVHDHGATRASGRLRIDAAFADVEATLTRSEQR